MENAKKGQIGKKTITIGGGATDRTGTIKIHVRSGNEPNISSTHFESKKHTTHPEPRIMPEFPNNDTFETQNQPLIPKIETKARTDSTIKPETPYSTEINKKSQPFGEIEDFPKEELTDLETKLYTELNKDIAYVFEKTKNLKPISRLIILDDYAFNIKSFESENTESSCFSKFMENSCKFNNKENTLLRTKKGLEKYLAVNAERGYPDQIELIDYKKNSPKNEYGIELTIVDNEKSLEHFNPAPGEQVAILLKDKKYENTLKEVLNSDKYKDLIIKSKISGIDSWEDSQVGLYIATYIGK